MNSGQLPLDGAAIGYGYNDGGRVWKRTDQRDLATYYVYDAGGNLTLKTNDPNDGGDWAVLADPNSYDPNDLIWAEAFTYDGLGRPLTAAKVVDGNDVSGSVFVYNTLGLLDSEQQTLFGGTPRTVGYGYDQYGYRTSITYPDGTTEITRTNTWPGQIASLGRAQAELVTYAYQGGRMAERTYSTTTPVTAEYHYDNLGRLTGIDAGAGRVQFGYTYWDNENNIEKMYFHHRGPTVYNPYGYGDIDRLRTVAYHNSDTESFVMDDLGNRTGNQTLRGEGTVNFAVDTLTNRYTAVGGQPLAYDDAGNLTQDKDGYQFTYDYENRIIEVRNSSDALVAVFDYDTQGRRIKVRDEIANKTTHYYYSDNWQVLAEYDGAGAPQAYYVFDNYIDEVLLMHRDAADHYYLHDHLYSPVALLDDTGAVVERYEYDAYGSVQILNSQFSILNSSQYGNPYAFTGRELDILDAGSRKLYHYRHRDYSPDLGRFLQQDPHGINPAGGEVNPFEIKKQYKEGFSVYQYGQSNPTIKSDPFGLYIIIVPPRSGPSVRVGRLFCRCKGECGPDITNVFFQMLRTVRISLEEEFKKPGRKEEICGSGILGTGGIYSMGGWDVLDFHGNGNITMLDL